MDLGLRGVSEFEPIPFAFPPCSRGPILPWMGNHDTEKGISQNAPKSQRLVHHGTARFKNRGQLVNCSAFFLSRQKDVHHFHHTDTPRDF